MRSQTRRLLMAVALTASVAVALSGCAKKEAASADDMSLGNPKAKVTVVEYASASCVHCGRWNNEVFPSFKTKYIDTGKVNYVYREFLTQPVQVAAASFLLARCAAKDGGKEKYFSVIDSVYHAQEEMFTTGQYREILLRIVQGPVKVQAAPVAARPRRKPPLDAAQERDLADSLGAQPEGGLRDALLKLGRGVLRDPR